MPIIEKSIICAGFNQTHPFCLVGRLGEFYKPLINKEFRDALIEPQGNAVDGAIAIALLRYERNFKD